MHSSKIEDKAWVTYQPTDRPTNRQTNPHPNLQNNILKCANK